MKIYNTLSRKIEDFIPLNPPKVGMYTCGQTVYDYTHIGHLRKYTGDDLLRRVLTTNGFDVQHVQNVTDVGHLTSDADEGDDKLEKGAKDRGETVWEVARFFEEYHFKSLNELNILRPNVVCRATEHIGEQIKLIEKLVKKGFTYQTEEAIYFDISKFPGYGKLSGQKLEEQKTGARKEVVVDPKKKQPADFALWFFTVGKFAGHTMRWPSPWGEGFPGWHIECSAMSMEYLGDSFDIHTGGVDHIPVHHENEIAQSEAVSGQPFVKYWVHHEFLLVEGEKMSKSKKNFYTIDDIKTKGFDPLALRYLFLTAHYRDKLNFTWESLEASQNALDRLREIIRDWPSYAEASAGEDDKYYQKFMDVVNNDLNIPQALAVMWDMVKSDYPTNAKAKTILKMDKILGLDLEKYLGKPIEVPEEVMHLVRKREQARNTGEFSEADKLRKQIKKLGYIIEDTPKGSKVKKD
ncbi:cysteine--tRNA ligase [Candidatus Daviesbacteria bacterium]|nr:cysteine--tRNA ligase [Candidatus Daviesbacteria bacterium]